LLHRSRTVALNPNLSQNAASMSSKSAKLLAPREAARLLGISYTTLKRWIYQRSIRTVTTGGGHHRIPEDELRRFVFKNIEKADLVWRESLRHISGRNQLVGRILSIKISGLMAQVTLAIGDQRITSIITADAVRAMSLEPGETVAALIKSTEVMIIRP